MIPYLGCKDSIASEILNCIPAAENFYDLFGGGGSITEAAYKFRENGLFGEWQKWQKFHYNEINKAVCKLVKAIWAGKFDFDYAKAQEPTKERYYAERRQTTEWGAFVSFAWSFGSKNENFIYSPKRLLGKRIEHLERIERMQRSAILKDVDSKYIRKLFSFANITSWNLTYGMRNVNDNSNKNGKELFISNYKTSIKNLFSLPS